MRLICSARAVCVLSVLLLTSACGPGETARKQADQLNNLSERRSSENMLFQLAVSDAQRAVAAKDTAGLARSVAELGKLGDKAIQRLSDQAASASHSNQDRVLALLLLGEMGPQAKAATGVLETIEREAPDAALKQAATEALIKIRAAK